MILGNMTFNRWLNLIALYKKQLTLFGMVLLILLITLLHSHVYGGRNYRQDEINSVHASRIMTPSEIVQWMATDVHPPGWRLFAEAWVEAFGGVEQITRWSSTLLNMLTFALLFQLGKRVIDTRTAFFAVALLGIFGFASSAMTELRPYPMLITVTTALHLVFYLWLKRPSGRLMVIYVMLGVAGLYTHFFSVFIFPVHALFMLVFVRYDRKLWLDSFLMWFFIGLSFTAWIVPFLYVILVPFPGGIYYAIPEGLVGLEILYRRIRFEPEVIQHFLLIFSLFAPTLLLTHKTTHHPKFRVYKHWGLLYPLSILVFTFAITFLSNAIISSLTARNLLFTVMITALLMALGLRLIPLQGSIILLIALYLGAPNLLAGDIVETPYREIVQTMSADYETDSILMTEFSSAFLWLMPASYYINDFTPDHMSMARQVHIINPNDSAHPPAYPERLENVYKSFDAETLTETLPEHQQLWHLQEGDDNVYTEDVQAWLSANYAHINTTEWAEDITSTYRLSQYQRAPQSDGVMLRADDNLELYSWSLQNDVNVNPCQQITVDSWWQAGNATSNPLQIQIILANDSRQLAITEKNPSQVFTTDWQADTYYWDTAHVDIPCDIPAGNYNLLLGMKDSITGESLSLTYADGNNIGTLYYLTTLNTQGH